MCPCRTPGPLWTVSWKAFLEGSCCFRKAGQNHSGGPGAALSSRFMAQARAQRRGGRAGRGQAGRGGEMPLCGPAPHALPPSWRAAPPSAMHAALPTGACLSPGLVRPLSQYAVLRPCQDLEPRSTLKWELTPPAKGKWAHRGWAAPRFA